MIEFGYDPELQARVATFRGVVDGQAVLEAYTAVLHSPDFDPAADVLVDLRGVTRLDVSGDVVRELVRAFTPFENAMAKSRRAVVAGDDLGFGLGRMYEQLRAEAPETIRIFRDYDQARAWLMESRADPPAA